MPDSRSIESPAVYRRRLESRPARRAIAQLCKDDESGAAKRLRAFVARLPNSWQAAVAETLTERRRRRERLARELRAGAKALAQDPEYSHLTLLELRTDRDYELHLLSSRASNRPTCAEVIAMIADEVAAPRSSDELYLTSRRGMDLKPYCLLALHFRLASWPKFTRRRSPHRQVEILISALLATSIKRDTLTHLLGPDARRKYTKDSTQD